MSQNESVWKVFLLLPGREFLYRHNHESGDLRFNTYVIPTRVTEIRFLRMFLVKQSLGILTNIIFLTFAAHFNSVKRAP